MASVDSSNNNPNDPNNPNNVPGAVSQPGQTQTNQPATSGGAGGVTATGAGNVTGQVVGTANPSQPFQNIASYLAANAQGGQQLAGQVANTVSQPITQANTDITNAAADFTKSVNTGYTPENKDLISAVSQNPAYVVAENPDNVTNFTANLNDKYTGPSDFTQTPGYSNLESEIANAQTTAGNTKSEAGIQSLLQGVEGPTTGGINKLDSLLLSADPTNYATIQAAGAPAANLLPTLTQTTTDQNALAGTGATNASTAASDAAAALQTALTGETGNLTGEQNTIQGIVDAYNKSIGVINPVTQTIAQDIQNFLAANPQLSLADATSALGPLMNLNPINAPSESTYASPVDYQQIAALAALGLDPTILAGLPINSSTANEAQTFQLPPELQNAIGQAPGVESALNTELNTVGGQISSAVAPFEAAQQDADKTLAAANADQTQLVQLKDQLGSIPPTIQPPGADHPIPNPDYQALQTKIAQVQTDLDVQSGQNDSDKAAMAQMAPGLQWVNQAGPGYNDLIQAINDQLGKLGSVGVPSLNYGPNTVTDPVTGAPIGTPAAKEIGNVGGIAAGVGGAAGAGIGAVGAGTADAVAQLVAGGMSVPEAQAAITAAETTGGNLGFGTLSALDTAGPAALAAYGTSNIVQNSIKNPIEAGVGTLANTGLSLATLSLPPAIFKSIGKDIQGVLNSIGNFFGGLF